MIRLRVVGRFAVQPYRQIVQQAAQALRMGVLSVYDQLPGIREVVTVTAVNPQHGAECLPRSGARGPSRGPRRVSSWSSGYWSARRRTADGHWYRRNPATRGSPSRAWQLVSTNRWSRVSYTCQGSQALGRCVTLCLE